MSWLVKFGTFRHIECCANAVIWRFFIFGWLVLMVPWAPAAPIQLDTLKVGSKVYSNVTVVGASATDLYFSHNQGITNVKLKYTELTVQQKFHYDPKSAADAEKQQTADDQAYREAIASKIATQAQKVAMAAQKAARTSEDSLADPISDDSLLGKPAPEVNLEKWLGQKPEMKGKCELIAFWAPWSIPCRKAIPQLNALQAKFANKLVVVGVTSDTQEEVEEMPGPKLEFASGIDSKGGLLAAAGASSIPFVLFVDASGTVRYQGHPNALDEKKLELMMLKPGEELPPPPPAPAPAAPQAAQAVTQSAQAPVQNNLPGAAR